MSKVKTLGKKFKTLDKLKIMALNEIQNKSKIGKGIHISLQLKEILINLKNYFENKNKDNNFNQSDVILEIHLATKLFETRHESLL